MPRVAREHWRVVKQLTFDYWVWLIHELMTLCGYVLLGVEPLGDCDIIATAAGTSANELFVNGFSISARDWLGRWKALDPSMRASINERRKGGCDYVRRLLRGAVPEHGELPLEELRRCARCFGVAADEVAGIRCGLF